MIKNSSKKFIILAVTIILLGGLVLGSFMSPFTGIMFVGLLSASVIGLYYCSRRK